MSIVWNPSDQESRKATLGEAEARFLENDSGADRKERLERWREWAAKKLLAEFTHWPADETFRKRQVGQCIAVLEVMARQLLSRGWLASGSLLARFVAECLAPISKAQRAGKIEDFYPYFRASVKKYVPVNAEDIQRAARAAGCDVAKGAFGTGFAIAFAQLREPSITEVIAERPATAAQAPCKPAARGRGRPRKDTGAGTPSLFDGVG